LEKSEGVLFCCESKNKGVILLNVSFIADRKEDRIKVTRNTTRQGGKYYGLEEK